MKYNLVNREIEKQLVKSVNTGKSDKALYN